MSDRKLRKSLEGRTNSPVMPDRQLQGRLAEVAADLHYQALGYVALPATKYDGDRGFDRVYVHPKDPSAPIRMVEVKDSKDAVRRTDLGALLAKTEAGHQLSDGWVRQTILRLSRYP